MSFSSMNSIQSHCFYSRMNVMSEKPSNGSIKMSIEERILEVLNKFIDSDGKRTYYYEPDIENEEQMKNPMKYLAAEIASAIKEDVRLEIEAQEILLKNRINNYFKVCAVEFTVDKISDLLVKHTFGEITGCMDKMIEKSRVL